MAHDIVREADTIPPHRLFLSIAIATTFPFSLFSMSDATMSLRDWLSTVDYGVMTFYAFFVSVALLSVTVTSKLKEPRICLTWIGKALVEYGRKATSEEVDD